jgi:hypothetical protein
MACFRDFENCSPASVRNSLAGTFVGRLYRWAGPEAPRRMAGHMIVWKGMLSLPRKYTVVAAGSSQKSLHASGVPCWSAHSTVVDR